MAIIILAPAPAVPYRTETSLDDDHDTGGVDLEGDADMRPSKRARRSKDIVTPGETVTDDPQWMRYAGNIFNSLRRVLSDSITEGTAHISLHPAQESSQL